ncbi:MAG TPA: beta-ketoacyl-ACP synthase III [Candidatus Krumholzibacteriaceae bacterium]|nr:beta-ketoacyl-ACP synthase III [Candidatus Krumholzibacteriaceae bacterium]
MSSGRQLRGTKIKSVGYHIPEKILTNEDFEKIVDTSDEWIVERTGIRERHIARDDEAASDISYEASVKALKKAGVKAEELDQIIVGTATSDMIFPSTACLLQDRLGAKNAAAYDLTAACSGFIFGVTIADAFISSGKADKILVVGVEILSRITDYTDRSTCVLFGDGAGAVVLESCPPEEGILSTFIKTDGRYSDLLYLPGGGSRSPLTAESIEEGEQYLKMKGSELFKYAVKAMSQAAKETLSSAGLSSEDVDFLIPHQANIRIIEGVRRMLKLKKEQVVINIDRMGNTSTASIPIALGELEEQDEEVIKKGDIVLLVAFGGGLTWGAVLFRK